MSIASPTPEEHADLRNGEDATSRWDMVLFLAAIIIAICAIALIAAPLLKPLFDAVTLRPAGCGGLTISDCIAWAEGL